MLNKSKFQCQALNPQAERDSGNPFVVWLLRQKRKRAERQLCQAELPELFVPDGRLALLVQNGRPDRWFEPGRHQLSCGNAKLEVRLISGEVLPDQGLDRALDLPYERALLYVDGVHVAIVKPGPQPGSPVQKDAGGALSAPAAGRQASPPALRSDEEDLFQDFSFV